MTRHATIRTTHDDPALIAAAIAPDNTAEMETTVVGDETVVTQIERETTGGLHATVDDYVVNVDVATAVVQHADEHRDRDQYRYRHRHADADADTEIDSTHE